MILVTGSTGHLGTATIDFLLSKGIEANRIVALARNAKKAERISSKGVQVRLGDYTDYASLKSAFTNVEKLLLISSSDLQGRAEQHENVINAAAEVGVKHIVYTSFLRKNETSTSPIAFIAQQHLETEKSLKASGIPYTLMLNGLYADVLPGFFGDTVLETGVFLPAGKGKAAFTARLDMAEAAASILTTEGHESKEYIIANTENTDLYQIAAILGEISGKQVNYLNPTKETYLETVTKAGLPQEYAEMFASFSQAIDQGEFETYKTDLKDLLGRNPTSIGDFLKQVYFQN